MNKKEVSEIRRRFRADKNNISRIVGCYVNEQREIIAGFSNTLLLMPPEESEKYLAIFRRTLSGTLGKNLVNIEFSTSQVTDGEEHKLLSALRSYELGDSAFTDAFFKKIIDGVDMEGNYLILLMTDTYDIPFHAKDGSKLEDSQTQFTYVLCSVCPVRLTKPALSYCPSDNGFHSSGTDWIVAAPTLGFMFPAFDDRAANIYGALYYTADVSEGHPEFTDAVFHTDMPMPAETQKEVFQSILSESLADECSYDVVRSMHGQLCEMIADHEADKTENEPLVISRCEVRSVLESCGVSQPRVEAFAQKYDEKFGAGKGVSPQNIVDAKQLEVRTPDVVIKVNPERPDLIDTRVIEGVKYVLIRADSGVELNGVSVSIKEE